MGYDEQLYKPYDDAQREADKFNHWFEACEEELRAGYVEKLISDGVLDDDLVDYDEDVFVEWCSAKWEASK